VFYGLILQYALYKFTFFLLTYFFVGRIAEGSEVVESAVVPPCPPGSGFVMAENMAHRDTESGQCFWLC